MNKKLKILINYFLAPILLVVLSLSLYQQVSNQPDLAKRWNEIVNSWLQWKFWLVLIGMLLNWGIEARKWQVLVQHVQLFSFWRAFKSVLSGCSITMLTPNRIGEYGGRILYVEEGHRIKAISLTVVGSIAQLLITLVMGCAGLFYLRFFSHNDTNGLPILPHFWGNVLLYLCISITLVLGMFYLKLGWLVRIIEKVPAFNNVTRHIVVLEELNTWSLLRILLLSFIRYLIFILQYILLLKVVGVEIAFVACFWLISVFYLVMAVAPTIGFVELPIRLTASWAILQFYTSNELGVGAAALGIWLINLVLPAIIGSVMMLKLKIVKDTDD